MPTTQETHATRDGVLDCVRAFAVFLVFATHFRGWLPGGTIGVSVFFCLSGYLIARILLGIELTRYNIAAFIFRRFMRVWPMMVFQIGLTAILVWFLQPDMFANFISDIPRLITFTGGYSKWIGYSPAVLWTLCAEFWFYVFFPIALVCVGKKHLLKLICGCILISVASKYLIGHGFGGKLNEIVRLRPVWHMIGPFSFTIVYLDSLMYGALCAALIDRQSRIVRWFRSRAFLWLPVCLICAIATDSFVAYNATFYVEMSGAAMLTGVIILNNSAHPSGPGYEPLATVGRISYSIYLLHAVAIDAIPQGNFNPQLDAFILIFIILAASIVTYWQIEQRAIRLSRNIAPFVVNQEPNPTSMMIWPDAPVPPGPPFVPPAPPAVPAPTA